MTNDWIELSWTGLVPFSALTLLNAIFAFRQRSRLEPLGFSTLLPSVVSLPLAWLLPRYLLASFACLGDFTGFAWLQWLLTPLFLGAPILLVLDLRRPQAPGGQLKAEK